MITREEYNKALDVVEAYHKQIFSFKKENRTTVDEWVNKHPKLPIRVYQALTHLDHNNERLFTYLDQVNQREFLRIRNIGVQAWRDFVDIRVHG